MTAFNHWSAIIQSSTIITTLLPIMPPLQWQVASTNYCEQQMNYKIKNLIKIKKDCIQWLEFKRKHLMKVRKVSILKVRKVIMIRKVRTRQTRSQHLIVSTIQRICNWRWTNSRPHLTKTTMMRQLESISTWNQNSITKSRSQKCQLGKCITLGHLSSHKSSPMRPQSMQWMISNTSKID